VVSKLNNDLNEVHTIRIVVKIYFIAIVHCLALFVTPAYAESLLPVNTKEVEPSVNVFTNKLEPREIVTEWFDMDSIRSDFGLTFLRSKITYSYVNDSEPKSVIYKEWAIKCDEKSFAQVTHRIKSSGSNISVAWPREKLAFKSPSGDDQRFLVDTACNFENTSEALKSKELARVIQEAIDRNPTIKKWQDKVKTEAKRKGFVENLNGRRRWFWTDTQHPKALGEIERAAVNMPIQSLGADIIKVAMIKSFDLLGASDSLGKKAKLILLAPLF